MRFEVGDSVKLLNAKSFKDGTKIPADTRGIVEKVFNISKSYRVNFSGFSRSRRILEKDLKQA